MAYQTFQESEMSLNVLFCQSNNLQWYKTEKKLQILTFETLELGLNQTSLFW